MMDRARKTGCLLLLLAGIAPCLAAADTSLSSIRAMYGLSKARRALGNRSPAAVARWLEAHGFNAVFGGYRDRRLVRALRKKGIRIFAEVPVFHGRKHWRRHPGSRPVTAAGKPLPRMGWYAGVCPNQAWLRKDRLRLIDRLVRRRGVDGIWLDFIRYPARWEGRKPRLVQTCFCPTCLRRLAADTGIAPPASARTPRARARWILDNHRARFVSWKTSRIAEFVKQARRVARAANPRVIVGLFGVPWRGGEHGDAIRAIVGQDFARLAPHLDVISPMVYHRMVGRGVPWIKEIVRYLHRLTHKPILPVIQACSVPSKLRDGELLEAARVAQEHPSSGVIVFSLGHFIREKRSAAWRRAPR